MTYIVRFLPDAVSDLRSHSRWYERKRRGLAARFEEAVGEQTRLLEAAPRVYKIFHRDIHRCSVPRFPYEIYFRIIDDLVVVLAVHGVRQDPAVLKERLGID